MSLRPVPISRVQLSAAVVVTTADGCAVCAQDTTWQAYNTWGGVCLYGGFGSRWCEDGAPRSYVASYNRPMVTRDYRAINAPFGALAAPRTSTLCFGVKRRVDM